MKLKVGTFNIQSGVDRKHYLATKEVKKDCSLAANAIRDLGLDICGINEINVGAESEGYINQPKFIADQLGFHYAFAKAIIRRNGKTEYGNALVSRYPILSVKCIPIQLAEEKKVHGVGNYYEDRVLLVAEILVNEQVITVMCAHFGLVKEEIELAIDTLKGCVDECKTPLLTMGDYNLFPESEHYARLSSFLTDTAVLLDSVQPTFPSEAPTRRIDYIFKNDAIKALSAYVPDVVASDHRPYVITIEV